MHSSCTHLLLLNLVAAVVVVVVVVLIMVIVMVLDRLDVRLQAMQAGSVRLVCKH